MNIRFLLPLITATLVCSGYTAVEARQPKRPVSQLSSCTKSVFVPKTGNQGSYKKSPRRQSSWKPAKTSVTCVAKTSSRQMAVQPKWKLFTAPDRRFIVLMPGTPQISTQIQKTYMGEINLQIFSAQPASQQVVYIVAYNDFPDSYAQLTNPQEILNNARDLALKTTQSNLIKQRNIRSSNGHPGKEIEYINSGGKVTKNRMYFAEGRLYQVMVMTTRKQEKTLSKTITGYLNSFQVVLKK